MILYSAPARALTHVDITEKSSQPPTRVDLAHLSSSREDFGREDCIFPQGPI